MLYQPLLAGKDAFFLSAGVPAKFEIHRHPEMELSFCLSGSYTVSVEKEVFSLRAGDLVLISPMAAHEYPDEGCGRKLTVELGPGFLGEYFRPMSSLTFSRRIFHLSEGGEVFSALDGLLRETCALWESRSEFSGLALRGNLYRISALILQHFLTEPEATASRSLRDVARVERALEMIYEHYATPLDLDCVCSACGFSKSSFCRIFRKVTGSTFHALLNRHRVEIACLHLREGSLPVSEIAVAVGFADAKSFCRAFRAHTGTSPGAYRAQGK
ncbi:MAG: helix-turn-helix domain-containing protein [Clostridia bacterium]|nr:helix-turn-helix domain-containing protein [Clostridia bacterium]